MTELVTFRNEAGDQLRGLLDRTNQPRGVIFVHGFERSTTEYQFKNFVDRLQKKVSLFRFDFSGCGISDGTFEDTTAMKQAAELHRALRVFRRECPDLKEIVVVAHSFGACVALQYQYDHPRAFAKMVFLGPAFNQRALQKYSFTCISQPTKNVTWANHEKFFSPIDFSRFVTQVKIPFKAHFVGRAFFKENMDKDYQTLLPFVISQTTPLLVVQCDEDKRVPPSSNGSLPKEIEQVEVHGGNHDFQRPDMVAQYMPKVLTFIKQI
jgi:pimeloyl-ACP methyl ester carboxylesterase